MQFCCKYENFSEKKMELNFQSFKRENSFKELHNKKIYNEIENINETIIKNNFDKFSINISENNKYSKIKETRDEKKIFGLCNIGFTCYMNSFLQILFHSPEFLSEINKFKGKSTRNVIINNLFKIIKNPNNENNLYDFKYSLKLISKDYSDFIQNDSQQFGIDLIEEIISEVKNEQYLKTESQSDTNDSYEINPKQDYEKFLKKYQNNMISLEKMFSVNEYTISQKNGKKEIRFETFLNINLFFPKQNNNKCFSLKHSLNELFDLKYNKSNNKKIRICNFPDILILTIVRVVLEQDIKYYKNELEFPEFLQLKEYADKDITKSDKSEYILFGVNKKMDYSGNNGHYYCEIKINDIWYKFDDSNFKSDIEFYNVSDEVVGLFYAKNKNFI